MEKKFKLKSINMPNFIMIDMATMGKREDGYQLNASIPVENLTEEEAIQYAEFLKEEFIEHWRNKKIKKNYER
jgi:hypothetical protein